MKVAIIGCGKQADEHASLIEKMPGCEIVGVCDREVLMARQLYERFRVKNYYDDVNRMLNEAKPQIVHITTPPHSHLELGKLCLEAGCHVFFEKPFTLNTAQAEEIIKIAEATDRKITVGHNNQYNNATIRMRELIRGGFLGGAPVHMESTWCYDLGDRMFAQAFLNDKTHWLRSLPGKLLHNIISHGIAKIAEYLDNDNPKVIAHGFIGPLLGSLGNSDIIDELRVIIYDNRYTTAYFTFSTQMKPLIRQFHVYGPKRSLIVDDMHQTLIRVCETDYKSYLNHFVPPFLYAKQYLADSTGNVKKIMMRELHFEAGRQELVSLFYRAITEGTPLPISYREILVTSRIMDSIVEQIYPAK